MAGDKSDEIQEFELRRLIDLVKLDLSTAELAYLTRKFKTTTGGVAVPPLLRFLRGCFRRLSARRHSSSSASVQGLRSSTHRKALRLKKNPWLSDGDDGNQEAGATRVGAARGLFSTGTRQQEDESVLVRTSGAGKLYVTGVGFN